VAGENGSFFGLTSFDPRVAMLVGLVDKWFNERVMALRSGFTKCVLQQGDRVGDPGLQWRSKCDGPDGFRQMAESIVGFGFTWLYRA
jgi:hypothetical protein